MCLLDLVKQHDRIGPAPDRFRQLSAFVIAHISRRRSDESGHGELLHILTHIDADHVIFVIKQILRQRLCKLCLADTGGPEEQEGADRSRRILDACLGAQDRLHSALYRFILPDNSLMELIAEGEDLLPLSFVELGYRYSCPAADHARDLFFADRLMDQGQILVLQSSFLTCQLLLEAGQFPVLKPGGLIQVALLLGRFDPAVDLIDLLSQRAEIADCILLIIPLCLPGRELLVQVCQLLLKVLKSLLGRSIRLLLQRSLLDLKLHDLPVHFIKLCRHGIQLGLDLGTCLIHQVDRLVRQEPVGDISVGEGGCSHQCAVGDLHAVIHLIALLQTSQD